ncbi:MAG TPA: hypothetical protein VHE53_01020, partial [Patescibacteria group bacterium]|nr:hypothetical protein [Patescibacteria group bacterium]
MGVRQELEDLRDWVRYDFSPGSAALGLGVAAALSLGGAYYLRKGFDHDIKQDAAAIAAKNLEIAGLKVSID